MGGVHRKISDWDGQQPCTACYADDAAGIQTGQSDVRLALLTRAQPPMWKRLRTTLSGACIAQGDASYLFIWLKIPYECVVCNGLWEPYYNFARIHVNKHLARLPDTYGMLAAQRTGLPQRGKQGSQ